MNITDRAGGLNSCFPIMLYNGESPLVMFYTLDVTALIFVTLGADDEGYNHTIHKTVQFLKHCLLEQSEQSLTRLKTIIFILMFLYG